MDTIKVGKSYFLKHLRLKVFKNVRFFNTTLSEPFVFKEIAALTDLVEVEDIDSLTATKITAKVMGVHTVKKSFLCINCNRKLVAIDEETMVHCKTCNLDMSRKACTSSWYIRILVLDVATSAKYHLTFLNDEVHQLMEVAKSHILSEDLPEDELAKFLLNFNTPIHLCFDSVEQRVTNISPCNN